jgi:hypothetical protein
VKQTTSLLPGAGVLLLGKEEKYKVLYINNFPSFIRRGVRRLADGVVYLIFFKASKIKGI